MVEGRIIQHDHAPDGNGRKQHLREVCLDHGTVAIPLEGECADEASANGCRDYARAPAPRPVHLRADLIATGCARANTAQAVVDAAFVEEIHVGAFGVDALRLFA